MMKPFAVKGYRVDGKVYNKVVRNKRIILMGEGLSLELEVWSYTVCEKSSAMFQLYKCATQLVLNIHSIASQQKIIACS